MHYSGASQPRVIKTRKADANVGSSIRLGQMEWRSPWRLPCADRTRRRISRTAERLRHTYERTMCLCASAVPWRRCGWMGENCDRTWMAAEDKNVCKNMIMASQCFFRLFFFAAASLAGRHSFFMADSRLDAQSREKGMNTYARTLCGLCLRTQNNGRRKKQQDSCTHLMSLSSHAAQLIINGFQSWIIIVCRFCMSYFASAIRRVHCRTRSVGVRLSQGSSVVVINLMEFQYSVFGSMRCTSVLKLFCYQICIR